MARREVTDDDIPKPEGGKFAKLKDLFKNVGDKFAGIYVDETPGNYGQDITFLKKDGSEVTITVEEKKQLYKLFAKADPQPGELVTITLVEKRDIGKENPMNIFKVAVDDAPPGAPKPQPKTQQADDNAW